MKPSTGNHARVPRCLSHLGRNADGTLSRTFLNPLLGEEWNPFMEGLNKVTQPLRVENMTFKTPIVSEKLRQIDAGKQLKSSAGSQLLLMCVNLDGESVEYTGERD